MTEIGVHEAKTHLSRLLKRVENGESFSITNRGKVVAVMVPPREIGQAEVNDAYSRLIELRVKFPIGTGREVTDWKNEGRR
ncbi:MAG: type II toxin-antitoxin system prevent-host-death family antitoxin [Candidatus Poribacteria bacterium]|nr:type II toxin-antitoxin system prevent-host-death family antitoxin [Candidatus Poribacteria bacterium]